MTMDHEHARMLISARFDGEPVDERAVDAHLTSCDACASFASRIERLSMLATRLPEVGAPDTLTYRIGRAVRAGRRRSRIAASLAAAAMAAAVVVAGLPGARFGVRPAAAAEALLGIRTLDVSREIVETDFEGRTTTTTERIRFRAPSSTRIDRVVRGPGGETRETEIRVPGAHATVSAGRTVVRTGLPPDPNPIPEPLSPALALSGRVLGPGPQIAGRDTLRVVLEDEHGTIVREALIDASRTSVLSSEIAVVLAKEQVSLTRTIVKRVAAIRYNPPLSGNLFALPMTRRSDEGFRARPISALSVAPAATPAGFAVVRSGSGPDGDAVLFARGSYTILVQIGDRPDPEQDGALLLPAVAGTGPARYVIGLYDLPALQMFWRGSWITISAPMSRIELERIAAQLFPSGAE